MEPHPSFEGPSFSYPECTLRRPSFSYPEEHTVCLGYLGWYRPQPNWKRWLSPFHHKTPRNAFCRGIILTKEGTDPPGFLRELSRPAKRRLSRGHKVSVLTPNHEFKTKVTLKYTRGDDQLGARGKGSLSMTFEDDFGNWESCGFDWGKTFGLDIWILLHRRSQQPISTTRITFLIEEAPRSDLICFQRYLTMGGYFENVWPRCSEAVDKYNRKYQERYGISLPQEIINEFRANFRYNILVPFRKNIYDQFHLDDWGHSTACRGFHIADDRRFGQQNFRRNLNYQNFKIVRDPKFDDKYTEALHKAQMIESDLAIKPWAMSICEILQDFLNSKFKEIKVENWDVMFGSPEKQDGFVKGYTPEVASFAISENSSSNDAVAIDPTIETRTYSAFLQSTRDLPFKLNRWCQIVRKESKPIPFIRFVCAEKMLMGSLCGKEVNSLRFS